MKGQRLLQYSCDSTFIQKQETCLKAFLCAVSHTAVCPPSTHHEVKLFCLLLVGPPLSDAGFAKIRLWHSGFDRLGGPVMVEALRHVVVFNGHHVLDCGQSGFWCFLYLDEEREKMRKRAEKCVTENAPCSQATSHLFTGRMLLSQYIQWLIWSHNIKAFSDRHVLFSAWQQNSPSVFNEDHDCGHVPYQY